jgi:hypothetical protein
MTQVARTSQLQLTDSSFDYVFYAISADSPLRSAVYRTAESTCRCDTQNLNPLFEVNANALGLAKNI